MAYTYVAGGAHAGSINGGTTTGIDTTGCDLLVVIVTRYSGSSAPTLSDSKSNVWTALGETTQGSDGAVRMYYCQSPTVGAGHSFTVSGSSTYSTVGFIGFSGSASSPFDTGIESGASSGIFTTTLQPGSVTPSVNGALLVVAEMFNNSSSATVSIDSGFTEAFERAPVSGQSYGTAMSYLVQLTAAAINPTVTISAPAGTEYMGLRIASFKPAGGGASFSPAWARNANTIIQVAMQ